MASARTGVFVDDYLEYSSSLPAELQRLLSTMRELDERSQSMVAQLREQVRVCLMKKREGPETDETVDKMRQLIYSNQTNALRLCTEKVLLAQQAFDLVDSHVKRLDEDLASFAEDLKQEGKIAQDAPPILPSGAREEKRKAHFFTPLAKRADARLDRDRSLEKERDRERERDRDSELMPPPGSHKKKSLPPPPDIDQPIDPDEPTYCICGQVGIVVQVSFGDMIACDNENCKGGEWFHYQCVGLSSETQFKGKWYCLTCRALQRRGLLDPPL